MGIQENLQRGQTVAVTLENDTVGLLTDTQLRATAVPVSVASLPTTTVEPDGTAMTNTQVSVDTTVGGVEVVAASAGRQGIVVTNQGSVACYLGAGTVSSSNGFLLNPGESVPIPADTQVKAISASSSTTLGVMIFA